MSVPNKRLSITIILILLATVISTIIDVQIVRHQAAKNLERYTQEERERIASSLRDQVDLAHSVVQQTYSQSTHFDYQKQVYGRVLQGVLAVLLDDINRKIESVASGEMTLKEAQERVISVVKQLRFGSEDDYVWIQTDELPYPRMVMHPFRSDLDGRILDSPAFDCARNRAENLFAAAVDVASNGGGFLDYLWERHLPGGASLPNIPKISYVARIPKWNWILGSGVFVDESVRDAITRLKSQLSALRYNNGNGSFFVHDLQGNVLVHPIKELVNQKFEENPRLSFVSGGLNIAKTGTGSGFFDFSVTDEKNNTVSNMAYARYFEPLGWVIGTSCSIGYLRKNLEWQQLEDKKTIEKMLVWNFLPLVFLLGIAVRLIRIETGLNSVEQSASAETRLPIEAESLFVGKLESDETAGIVREESSVAALTEALRVTRELGKEQSAEQIRLLSAIHSSLEKLAEHREPESGDRAKHGKKS